MAFGANVNAKNSFNQTPLDVAAENQVRCCVGEGK